VRRRIIQWGFDTQDTAYLRANSLAMEASEPFQGVVFWVMDGATNLGNYVLSSTTQVEGDYAAALADLQATVWLRWDSNFPRVNILNAVDLFGNWVPTLANAGLMARTAYLGGCRGICFDIEEYGTVLWTYSSFDAGRKAAHTFGEYQAQAKVQGAAFMAALNAEFPAIHVFCPYGPYFPAYRRTQEANPEDALYGLAFEFFEGMLETMDSGTRLIEGFEPSYGYRTCAQFRAARDTALALPISAFSPAAAAVAAAQMAQGKGIWLDNQNGVYPWDAVDLSNNWFAPQELAYSIRQAWGMSSEENGIVWLYNQTPRWRGVGSPMQADYADAVETALRTPDLSALVARTHALP